MKTPRALLAGTSLALVLTSAASAGPQPAQPPPPGAVQRQNTLKEAAMTPLEDVNVRKVPIPDVLKAAVVKPYDLTNLGNCAGLSNEIRRIDLALGADFDTPAVVEDKTRLEQAKGGAATVTRVGAQMLMPFRGVVRQLSGANAYQRELTEAIEAGSARRGFLKGVGMRLNCAPPAAPYGFRPAVVVPVRGPTRQAAPPPPAQPRAPPPPRRR